MPFGSHLGTRSPTGPESCKEAEERLSSPKIRARIASSVTQSSKLMHPFYTDPSYCAGVHQRIRLRLQYFAPEGWMDQDT